MCDVINFVFSRAYLAHPWSIFSQISVCYSWENSLSEKWQPFSNWMTSSWSKSWIKGDIAKFTWFTCYVYGTRIFLESGSYIATFLELYLGHLCSIFFQILICYSWDYKLSQMCLHFYTPEGSYYGNTLAGGHPGVVHSLSRAVLNQFSRNFITV